MVALPIESLNVVVVRGTIAAPPEHRRFESGANLLRYLITTRSSAPRRRVDVLPVVFWDPGPELLATPGSVGETVWVVGAAQRRYRTGSDGRRSEVELVAHQLGLGDPPGFGPGEDDASQ